MTFRVLLLIAHFVKLPTQCAPNRPAMNNALPKISGQSSRLLVVDDDFDTRANLSDILSDLGYEVRTAADAAIALRLIEEQAFDVVLLDLKLPGIDGLQLYREVKHRSPATLAILITGFADSDTRMRAEQLGVWRILPKPVDVPALLPLISEAAAQPLLLIIDDDHDFCASLADVLRDRRYGAGSGAATEPPRIPHRVGRLATSRR
jgi:CheY-like chemotaxis protein